MRRRFGMWIAIICILVVGVSVTKLTRDFVTSQGVETATLVQVADTGKTSVTSGGNTQSVEEETNPLASRAGKMPIPGAANKQADEKAVTETEAAVAAAEAGPGSGIAAYSGESTFDEPVAISSDGTSSSEDLMCSGVPEAMTETAAEAEAASETVEETETVPETVKSPLDPVIEKTAVVVGAKEETVSYGAESFFERFAATEKNVVNIWENITTDNLTAYQAAADQERVLWDYELNLVYTTIRSKMSEKEAEDLKLKEVEWIKERDRYAEKKAAKSGMKNAQNQNPEYTKAIAEKTKERCYWLVSEYEGVLNRESGNE